VELLDALSAAKSAFAAAPRLSERADSKAESKPSAQPSLVDRRGKSKDGWSYATGAPNKMFAKRGA